MPDLGICQAQKKAPPKRGQFAHREVDSGLSMLANNCSRQAFSNMFVLRAPIFVWVRFAFEHVRLRPKTKKNEHAPPEGEGLLGALFTPRPDPRFRWCVLEARSGRLVGAWG